MGAVRGMRRLRDHPRPMLTISLILNAVSLTVILGLTLTLILQRQVVLDGGASTCVGENVTVDVVCAEERVLSDACRPDPMVAPCKLGYLLPEYGACETVTAPPGTACSSICHVPDAQSAVCDGAAGNCVVADLMECAGMCTTNDTSVLNASLPFETAWIGVTEGVQTGLLVVWSFEHMCYYNRTMLFVLAPYWMASTSNTGDMVGYTSCEDFLVSSWVADHAPCLNIKRYLIDPNMTDPVHFFNDTAQPVQFSLCRIFYDCAQLILPFADKRAIVADAAIDEASDRAYMNEVARQLLHAPIAAKQDLHAPPV